MKSENRPLLIYDGDCNLCRRWVLRWSHATGDRVDYLASQETAHRYPEITPEQFQSSVQLVQPDGSVHNGAEAVFLTLAFNPTHRWPLWLYRNVSGVALVTEFAYGFVARHRRLFNRFARWLG